MADQDTAQVPQDASTDETQTTLNAQAEQPQQDQQPDTQPSVPDRSYKILVVDDEPDARELFAELLRTNPAYEVTIAGDGNEALAEAEKTHFDLILLDIVMPNLDGVDTLAAIKGDAKKYGEPVVVMLTNIGGDIAIQEAIKLGAIGYKLKIDTEPEELLQFVDKALKDPASVATPVQE